MRRAWAGRLALKLDLPRPLVGSVFDSNGVEQFGIIGIIRDERARRHRDRESVGRIFSARTSRPASTAGIPLVGLNPQVSTTGGTLAGGQTLYYAISAVDANGAESGLSFIAMANIPAGTNTNQVTLGQSQLLVGAAVF